VQQARISQPGVLLVVASLERVFIENEFVILNVGRSHPPPWCNYNPDRPLSATFTCKLRNQYFTKHIDQKINFQGYARERQKRKYPFKRH